MTNHLALMRELIELVSLEYDLEIIFTLNRSRQRATAGPIGGIQFWSEIIGWRHWEIRTSTYMLDYYATDGLDRNEYKIAKPIVARYPDFGTWAIWKLALHECAHAIALSRYGITRSRNGKRRIWHDHNWLRVYAELMDRFVCYGTGLES